MNSVHISWFPRLTGCVVGASVWRVSSARVQERREARIDVILDTATTLVVGGGLEALTLQRLAAELGVATSALYRYFPGKTELVVALQVRAIAALTAELGAALEGVEAHDAAGALAAVWAALDLFLAEPERAPARHRLIDTFLSAPEAQLDAPALAEVEQVLAPLLARVSAALAHAARLGALAPGDAEVRTRLAWAAAHGLHHLRRRDRIEPRARRFPALARALVDSLFAGWGAPPELRAEAHARMRAARRRSRRADAR